MPSFWGDPGSTQVIQTRGTGPARPPGFQFAQWLFRQLPGLMNTPFPTYQGQLDPGMSPTMQDVIRRAQGYAGSSPPEILAGIHGSLGRFMSPGFVNPWNSLWRGGAPRVPTPMPWGGPRGGYDGSGINPGGGEMRGSLEDPNWNRMPDGGISASGGLWGFGTPHPRYPPRPSPWNAGAPELFGGANNYYQVDPNQRVWGGGTAGSHTYQPPMPQPWGYEQQGF